MSHNITIIANRKNQVKKFLKDRNGSFAAIYALALLPLAAATGTVVDYTRAATTRTKLQAATDAAALSLGREAGLAQNEMLTHVENVMSANLRGQGDARAWRVETVSSADGLISVKTRAEVNALFLQHLTRAPLTVEAQAEVKKGRYDLEVTLALDNTGSMATNNRIGKLREAALKLVDVLEGAKSPTNSIKVSLVPFVTAVNVKAEGAYSSSWMDTQAKSDFHGINFSSDASGARANHFDLFQRVGVTWKGCVEARPEPFDISDTPPSSSDPKTLFVPYFWPDEPDSGISYATGTSYNNNWLPDGVSGTDAAARQRATEKYRTGNGAIINEYGPTTRGPNKSCPTPVLPLTADLSKARTEISRMREWNESGTNISEGLAWAWRMLSPEPPFTEGRPYDTPGLNKAIVLLTDGENQVWGGWNSHNKSDYTSYNYLANGRLGSTDRNTAAARVNDKIASLCASIKAKGVKIYTITLELGSSTLQNLFRSCASRPSMYYNSPSATELDGVFRAIATDLVNLHISR